MSTTSFAQESKETVVVTGSRIPQVGVVSASPVTMVSQEELKLQGTTDVGTLMNNLPSVFAGQTSGEGNGSSGTVTVNLRGLGAARTLVLIDGKRLGPGDAELPFPDLNQIPAALVDHTEVLTGGASAVYGSDAVAGVVNFIMRKDFEGVELDATAGAYQHNNGNGYTRGLQKAAGNVSLAPDNVFDGATYDFNFLIGTNTADGKGNITAYLGYQRQNQVLQKDRDFSACSISNSYSADIATYDYQYCAGSSNYARFKSNNGATVLDKKGNAVHPTYFMGAGGALTTFTGSAAQTYNYGAVNSLIRPQTRYTGGAFAHYEVDKKLDVYANFMFMDTHNSWQAAPSAAFNGQGPGAGGTLDVSCNNPLLTAQFITLFCPGGVSSAQTASMLIGRRNVEGGARVTDFRHTSYRMVIGAKGEIADGWSYDVSAQEGLTLYQQLYLHDWSKAAVQNSLLYDPATGTCLSGTCLDLFHGIGSITTAMENAVYSHGQRTGSTEEQVLNANITGDLGQYGVKTPWADGGVGVSFGAEYRKEILEEITSVADYSGDLFGAGSASLGTPKAAVWDWEIFGETQIPLVTNVKYIENLSLNAGYRYSSFSTSGAKAVHSYKYGLEYQPVDDLKFRASFQRAVRAANIIELYQQTNVQLGSFSDPCANDPGHSPSASLAGCQASGMTAAQYGHVDQCVSNQCNYQVGGNLALKPEGSDTKSLGIVLTPTFLPGFSMTVDYFNIDVKDYINIVQPTVSLSGCTSLTNTALCPLIHRSSGGDLWTTTGYIVSTNVNTGYLKTSGVDVQANYLTDLQSIGLGDNGSFSTDVFGTYVSNYLVQPYTGASTTVGGVTYTNYDCVGKFGKTCGTPTPSWRHKARVTWASPWNFDVSLQWRHLSGSKFDGNDANPYLNVGSTILPAAGGKIAAYDYLDISGTYQVSEKINLNFGINNVLDRNPPVLSSGGIATGPTGSLNGNTFNGVYDSLGRYMFFGIVLKS
jgi:outer membrane receptor protein involved in Fe transport